MRDRQLSENCVLARIVPNSLRAVAASRRPEHSARQRGRLLAADGGGRTPHPSVRHRAERRAGSEGAHSLPGDGTCWEQPQRGRSMGTRTGYAREPQAPPGARRCPGRTRAPHDAPDHGRRAGSHDLPHLRPHAHVLPRPPAQRDPPERNGGGPTAEDDGLRWTGSEGPASTSVTTACGGRSIKGGSRNGRRRDKVDAGST